MDGTSARAALGLGPGAGRHEVRRAYRALAKRTHPDAGGDRFLFEQVTRAYELALRSAPTAGSAHRFLVPGALADRPTGARRRPSRSRRARRSFAEELRRAMAA